MYNIMTCEGFGFDFLGDCTMAWASLAITFFLALILRRQCNDGVFAGTSFNFLGALILGLGANLILITLLGQPRWSLLAGIGGVVVGGLVIGKIFESEGGGI